MNLLENNLRPNETARRKTLGRIILILISGFILIFAAILCWITQPLIFVSSSRQPIPLTVPANLKNHVRVLSSTFAPSGENTAENLRKKAAYIKQEFEKTGAQVSEQKFFVSGIEYSNVIATFGAESPEKIVIGAHYDTAGGFPGADDNSSGVAAILELSRIISEQKTSQNVELVCFALEEPPFFGTSQMGSYFYARSLREHNQKIRLMICLEMIGYFTDNSDSQDYPISLLALLYPSKGNFITVVGNFGNGLTARAIKSEMSSASDLPVCSINAPTFVAGVDFSDHRNFWQFGVDAVMITDTAFYRNKNYHTPNDTMEKLDYDRLAKVVDAVFSVIK